MGDIMSEVSSKELYEFKKTLKELSQIRGRGTELVSVYIPPDKQLSDVGKHMRDELGQSANIKSKQTKKNVQSAIEVILQSIRLYKQPPENGIVLFVGIDEDANQYICAEASGNQAGVLFTRRSFTESGYWGVDLEDYYNNPSNVRSS